jgi:hypothetical protein
MLRFRRYLCKEIANFMPDLLKTFLNLNKDQKRTAHLELCRNALIVWNNYVARFDEISYVESVVGTFQIVDKLLPNEAFDAVNIGKDSAKIDLRYAEPINAMHDEDLEFPENIKFAYYAVYNLFNKYIMQQNIDDWLICNQALSAETVENLWQDLLRNAILKASA